MHIEIKKITNSTRKTENGETPKDPRTGKPLPGPSKVVTEFIRKDEIKSFREWHRSDNETIPGAITLIYMMGKTGPDKREAQIMIQEDFRDFGKRIGSTLADGE
ncbi:MAG: hypothetical protein COB15_09690 [Flavobacteriales bacterium]|jgi:hypothetical protein|nr:MAG: hypothetical protein COB15_09690 [Flavobacteriales bacterium]